MKKILTLVILIFLSLNLSAQITNRLIVTQNFEQGINPPNLMFTVPPNDNRIYVAKRDSLKLNFNQIIGIKDSINLSLSSGLALKLNITDTTSKWLPIGYLPKLILSSGSYSNPTWLTSLAWSKITGAPAFITGNQNITFTGDATGSGTTAVTLTLASSGVTADTYDRVTVNAKGLVTSGTKRSIPAAIASGSRTIGTSYQVSTTQWSSVTLSASASVNIVILGNATGTIFAEISPNGTSGWIFSGNISKNTASLVGLSTTNGGSATIAVPPGYYYRLSTTSSVSGVGNAATFTFDGGSYYTE